MIIGIFKSSSELSNTIPEQLKRFIADDAPCLKEYSVGGMPAFAHDALKFISTLLKPCLYDVVGAHSKDKKRAIQKSKFIWSHRLCPHFFCFESLPVVGLQLENDLHLFLH